MVTKVWTRLCRQVDVYVQNAKAMAILRTEMNTIVQCLNCWSEGEIDETIWARDYTPIVADELQSSRKED